MSEPFVGEIRMFAGNFAPRGWAFCDGQLIAVSQNDALFSLLSTTYGGDGRTTFALPDMRGRVPLHQGSGPGLSPRRLGSKGGTEDVTITSNQMASHSHSLNANTEDATAAQPMGAVVAKGVGVSFYKAAGQNESMAYSAVTNTGGTQSHVNLMPTLCVNFIIALYGVYPSRN